VQNCAQIDRKCTLFRPKTPFFAHFCRGEGRLFGRPKIGVLGGPGVARTAPPKTSFLLRKNSPTGSDGRIATLQRYVEIILKRKLFGKIVCFACIVAPMEDNLADIRSLPKGRSPLFSILLIFSTLV
jgi:hypothetical protein